MYPKYTTECFIVSARSFGESDRSFRLFTAEFGMIKAAAKSVRLDRSKLKSLLEAGNCVCVSLVRGKDVWRITDCFEKEAMFQTLSERKIFMKLLKLLDSLVHGEEKNDALFANLKEVYRYIRSGGASEENLKSPECAGAALVLDSLGYGQDDESWRSVVKESVSKSVSMIAKDRTKLVGLINNSINQSHLVKN